MSIENNKTAQFMIETLSEITGDDKSKIDVDREFDSYGLSSTSAVIMLGELEEFVDMDLSPSLLFEHNTIRTLTTHLDGMITTAREA